MKTILAIILLFICFSIGCIEEIGLSTEVNNSGHFFQYEADSSWTEVDFDKILDSSAKKTDKEIFGVENPSYQDLIRILETTVSRDTRPITRQDLFDYFQECYKDSSAITLEGRYSFKQEGVSADGRNNPIGHFEYETDTLWIHKELTLQGFKEWLEKH